MADTKQQFFKPTKVSTEKKAADTNSAARGIVQQEAVARDKKTERLRALRLAKEAATPTPPPQKRTKK
ncbi:MULTISPECIES: hypothetical protein [unclassified Rhizobium]|uniref:hypothetical protein n=1 Tax=unclassified Rhizobium TaxID=2613769 RepID=UPI0006F37092|nr:MULTISPECIES: hypothetical protein [unclassified Rhizobium]KQV41689.1 hypothetical protein ASC86_19900 [Rhizobium sp. Root1212]KRD32205.1 hypothetical protein ASE37_22540 [Rhizobium sp. Root268]